MNHFNAFHLTTSKEQIKTQGYIVVFTWPSTLAFNSLA